MVSQQMYAIWWKNLKLRRRYWIMTLFELTIPIICFIFVVLIRSKVVSKAYVNETYHDSLDDEPIHSRLNIHDMKLYYAPKTDFTTDSIRRIQMKLNIYKEGVKGFSSEKELISFYDKHGDENVNAVVLFEDVDDNMPAKLKYIKMYKDHVLRKMDPLFVAESESEKHLQKGFLHIQLAPNTSFIELASEKDSTYPPRLQDNGNNSFFLNLLPIITACSFIVLCVSTLNRVANEKSLWINALRKMYGLISSTLWVGWLINGMVFCIIPVTGVVLLLKCSWEAHYSAIEYCDGLILFLFLLLYCAASISSLLALTTLFAKPVISMAVGVILWIVSSVVFYGATHNVRIVGIGIGLLLIPNISLFRGYTVIANFEQREKELNFSNLSETPTGSSDDVTMGLILVMLVVATIFYFIFTLCIDLFLSELKKEDTNYPQDILFTDLTVSEQLIFFGMLRGLSTVVSRHKVNEILQNSELCNKGNYYTGQLSEELKNDVSSAISDIARLRVHLDEPVTGIEGRAAAGVLLCRGQSNPTLVSARLMEEGGAF